MTGITSMTCVTFKKGTMRDGKEAFSWKFNLLMCFATLAFLKWFHLRIHKLRKLISKILFIFVQETLKLLDRNADFA